MANTLFLLLQEVVPCFLTIKNLFTIVLLAICNASYEFVMVDIGEAGHQSDAGVFANSNREFTICYAAHYDDPWRPEH